MGHSIFIARRLRSILWGRNPTQHFFEICLTIDWWKNELGSIALMLVEQHARMVWYIANALYKSLTAHTTFLGITLQTPFCWTGSNQQETTSRVSNQQETIPVVFTTRLQRQAAQSRSPVSSHPVAWDLWIFGSADRSGPSGRAVRGGDPWRFAPRAPCFAPGVWFQPASQCGKPKNSPILSPEMDAIRCHKPSINEGLWPSWVYHIRSKTIQSCPGKKHQWCMDNLPCCEMIRNDMNFCAW